MDARTLRSQVERIDTLPTIPNILKKLFEVIENPKTSLNEIGNFILKDPVLTSRVLKMVNSPIYGFPGRISSMKRPRRNQPGALRRRPYPSAMNG